MDTQQDINKHLHRTNLR